MKKQINISGLNIPVVIQSYTKSKSVKILYKKDYLKVTKPIWYSNNNIVKYIKDNIDKIKKEYEKAQTIYIKEEKEIKEILYLGNKYNICILYNKDKFDIYIKEDKLYIELTQENISNENLKIIIKNYLKEKSRNIIEERLLYNSNKTNIQYNKYRIKDCKTIWGSCSNKNNINLNYKLIMLPVDIIDQIIIHELCHIKYLNHSKKFWNLVYSYHNKEKYDKGEKWIKENKDIINII